MILQDQKLFKMVAAVDNIPQPFLVVVASTMDQADSEVIMHYAEQPDYAGLEVRIISAGEINPEVI